MATQVLMPKLSESVVEGTISQWLKQVGDKVAPFEPLCSVTTDKVEIEIPSPVGGVISAIYVQAGDTVAHGLPIAQIGELVAPDTNPTDTAPMPATEPVDLANRDKQPDQQDQRDRRDRRTWFSPLVKRMAAQHRLDLARLAASLEGTGQGGRITQKDLRAYLESRPTAQSLEMPATPASPSLDLGSSEFAGTLIPLNAMRRTIAEHMVRSQLHTAPHAMTLFEIDMTTVWSHWQQAREASAKQGVRLTITAYLLQAVIRACQAQPILNSQWRENGLFVPRAVNLGVAVAVPDGLLVPVIHQAQDLNVIGLARRLNDLTDRARHNKLQPQDVQGGTISVTNHGVTGSLLATPIIHQPQSAIVGIGAITKRVVVLPNTDAIAIRSMMYATLTFDHRVTDGATADAFMQVFKSTLEEWAG
jgi:2-oxoglutarate dehydrogenase E2 component (dihydrolipoamide succinyltransferase)